MFKQLAKNTGFALGPLRLPRAKNPHIHHATAQAHLLKLLTRQHIFTAFAIFSVSIASAYTVAFFWPRAINFSYSSASCITNPTLFPGMSSQAPGNTFTASAEPTLNIAGHTIYSHRLCLTPIQAPKANVQETLNLSVFLAPYFRKTITVSAGSMPALKNKALLEKPISPVKPMVLTLDQTDRIFDYQVTVGDKTLPCTKKGPAVVCDIVPLELAQSATYTLALARIFHGEPANTILNRSVTIVEAIRATGSSIVPGQTVYNIPTELTVNFNKAIESTKNIALYAVSGAKREVVASTIKTSGATLTATFGAPLARNATFEFVAETVIATDGAYLDTPFSMQFITSGGPKVLGVSIGSYKVSPSATITITFDTAISESQVTSKFVTLSAGGSAVASTVSVSGNKIKITPTSDLPRCTALRVAVADGIQNSYGVSGGSAWQYTSRTICQTVFSIGTSVQGRAITAYRFGSGASKIVFVGGTHGNEKSSVYTLNAWIDHLEASYDRIPANRTIIVIPNLNPDGFAANRRTNANNVDLNRNFPADDWKQGVTMPDQTYNANGGGSAPLSEPESSALASYVLGQDPRLVLTYHASASVVIPNDSGDSVALAHTYDQKSNVGFASNGETDTIFEYDTTGAFEDWLHDKHDITALLIELSTKTANEFSGHQNALWAMAQLP